MRDRRFVAVHRGGLLGRADHAFLARWAADCAERVLFLFARESDDDRPRQALDVARAWASGEVKTGVAMKASLAAHAAARAASEKAAVAVARAAGHAVATAHAADHSMGALLYALKALEASGAASDSELELQLAKLPAHLLGPVSSGMEARLKRLGVRGGRSLNGAPDVDNSMADELQAARRPIASLISKSEKALDKLVPGTRQHTMLRDNLKALHMASALMNGRHVDADNFTRDELRDALRAMAAMTDRSEKARGKFAPGTPQHTLQRNRLRALRLAEALTKVELDKREG